MLGFMCALGAGGCSCLSSPGVFPSRKLGSPQAEPSKSCWSWQAPCHPTPPPPCLFHPEHRLACWCRHGWEGSFRIGNLIFLSPQNKTWGQRTLSNQDYGGWRLRQGRCAPGPGCCESAKNGKCVCPGEKGSPCVGEREACGAFGLHVQESSV